MGDSGASLGTDALLINIFARTRQTMAQSYVMFPGGRTRTKTNVADEQVDIEIATLGWSAKQRRFITSSNL